MTDKEVVKKVTVKKDLAKKETGLPAATRATLPAEVVALAKELKLDADTLLGWRVYEDRVVIISMNGMKFSSALKDGRSSKGA